MISANSQNGTHLSEVHETLQAAADYVLCHLNQTTSDQYDPMARPLLAIDDLRRLERFRVRRHAADAAPSQPAAESDAISLLRLLVDRIQSAGELRLNHPGDSILIDQARLLVESHPSPMPVATAEAVGVAA